jgi:hypothetical protein
MSVCGRSAYPFPTPSGRGIERDQPPIIGPDEHLTLVKGDAAIDDVNGHIDCRRAEAARFVTHNPPCAVLQCRPLRQLRLPRFACKQCLCTALGVVAMLGRLRRSVSRQFSAMALIFALMLQSMAVAAAAGPIVAGADPNWPGFEICLHNGAAQADGNAATPGGAPEHSGVHCIFCLAGSGQALEAPLPNADFHIIERASAPWPFTEWRLPAFTVDATARPRGPPPAA